MKTPSTRVLGGGQRGVGGEFLNAPGGKGILKSLIGLSQSTLYQSNLDVLSTINHSITTNKVN